MEYNKKKFAKRLKDLREEKGITQEALADALGISRPNIGKYENGQIDLSTELLVQYAAFFECSVEYVLALTNNKKEKIDPNDISDNEIKIIVNDITKTKLSKEAVDIIKNTLKMQK